MVNCKLKIPCLGIHFLALFHRVSGTVGREKSGPIGMPSIISVNFLSFYLNGVRGGQINDRNKSQQFFAI